MLVTNVHFLRWMALQDLINHHCRRSALDFLLVIHYSYECIPPILKKLSSIIRHFCFGWEIYTGAVFRDFEPVDMNTTHRTPKRHIRRPSHIFWAIIRQNPLRIVAFWLVDETRKKCSHDVVALPSTEYFILSNFTSRTRTYGNRLLRPICSTRLHRNDFFDCYVSCWTISPPVYRGLMLAPFFLQTPSI